MMLIEHGLVLFVAPLKKMMTIAVYGFSVESVASTAHGTM